MLQSLTYSAAPMRQTLLKAQQTGSDKSHPPKQVTHSNYCSALSKVNALM